MAPPDHVLIAFGVDPPARLLPGGQRTSWRAAGVVVKPVGDLAEANFVADTLAVLPERGFRVARPVRSTAGSWVVDGWAAFSRVAGVEAGAATTR